MTTVAEIEQAIERLSSNEKTELVKSIAPMLEDYLDSQVVEQSRSEGDFEEWSTLKTEINARFDSHR